MALVWWNLYHPATNNPSRAVLLVAMAVAGGSPRKIRTGIVRRLVPPTNVPNMLAINPAKNIRESSNMLMYKFFDMDYKRFLFEGGRETLDQKNKKINATARI